MMGWMHGPDFIASGRSPMLGFCEIDRPTEYSYSTKYVTFYRITNSQIFSPYCVLSGRKFLLASLNLELASLPLSR
jgi:hypothetical protein